MNETQRAVVASRLANMGRGDNQHSVGSANLPMLSQSKASEMLNVGDRTVRTVLATERTAPELVQQMSDGVITANEASKIAKLEPEERSEIIN